MPRMRTEEFENKIRHMQLTIAPIFPLPDGDPHPEFPETMLGYNLLTEELLDSLAHYYHQTEICEHTFEYPQIMGWDQSFFETLNVAERTDIKRRKFGKFIGLRGCETPTEELMKRIDHLKQKVEEHACQEMEQEEAKRKAGSHWRS